MLLKNLHLQNFRNYTQSVFEFSGVTLIVGPNGSGKTNILEAIYLLSRGRSFRTAAGTVMVRFGEEVGRVGSNISNSVRTVTQIRTLPSARTLIAAQFEVVLTRGQFAGKRVAKKRLLVNGVGKRLRDFSGQLKAVLFRPEDLDLILGSPSLRRAYLDDVLSLVDREYLAALMVYEKGLRQRNRLLEMIKASRGETRQLFYWNQLLVKNGAVIGKKRKELIDWLNRIRTLPSARTLIPAELRTLPSARTLIPAELGPIGPIGQIGFRVEYKENRINLDRLEKYLSREIGAGMTLIGPQRDDMIIKIQNSKFLPAGPPAGWTGRQGKIQNYQSGFENLAIYGSRGEQRWAVLWLKLAEADYVEEKTGHRPVLLLDDIFSELDKEHRELVKSIIGRQQTVVTATDLGYIDREEWGDVRVIELE